MTCIDSFWLAALKLDIMVKAATALVPELSKPFHQSVFPLPVIEPVLPGPVTE